MGIVSIVVVGGCSHVDPLFTTLGVSDRGPEQIRIPQSVKFELGDILDQVDRKLEADCSVNIDDLTRLSGIAAVRIALCRNPKTREAWANIRLKAAELGRAEAALLPTISARGNEEGGSTYRRVPTQSFYNQKNYLSRGRATVEFDWLLFDGGANLAGVGAAREGLIYEEASQNATLLSVMLDTSRQYYSVVEAETLLKLKIDAENASTIDLKIVKGRYVGGAAPYADVLRADAALKRAKLERIQAEANLSGAAGDLLFAMGMPINTSFKIREILLEKYKTPSILELNEALARARQNHPAIQAAVANLQSRYADAIASRAQSVPTVTFNASYSPYHQKGAIGQSHNEVGAEKMVGLTVKIPLPISLDNIYAARAAEANVTIAEAQLHATEQNIAHEVWSSLQNLQGDVNSITTANEYVLTAQKSYELARGRYTEGIGNIIELTDAQVGLASARESRIRIISKCIADRLALLANTASLNLENVE